MPRQKRCDHRISVGLPAPLWAALSDEADREGRSVAELCRWVLIDHAARDTAARALAARKEAA